MVHQVASPARVTQPYYIQCPVCEARTELVVLDSIRIEQGQRDVTVHDGVVEAYHRIPLPDPEPRVEMQFHCFAGHRFVRRLRATDGGRVALTEHTLNP